MGLLTWSVGNRVTATRLNRHNPVTATRTSDVSVTSDTSTNPDTELVITLLAGITYDVHSYAIVTAASSTPDFRRNWTWTNPATVTTVGTGLAPYVTGTQGDAEAVARLEDSTSGTTETSYAASTTASVVIGHDRVVVGSSANTTLTYNWAQATSSADSTTLKDGSWVTAIPVQ